MILENSFCQLSACSKISRGSVPGSDRQRPDIVDEVHEKAARLFLHHHVCGIVEPNQLFLWSLHS